jgi:hypothetical protein
VFSKLEEEEQLLSSLLNYLIESLSESISIISGTFFFLLLVIISPLSRKQFL